MENGSGSAINALSKSKTRYQHQDQLLLGFLHMPNSTAKEVAAEYHNWMYEKYADASKRATDLSSERLGYLELVGNRECRRSGKDAHIYRITERGIQHLQDVGLMGTAAPVVGGRSGFASMREALAG
jgi:hypothetical protein